MNIALRVTTILLAVFMAPAALAIEAGQVDDFEDGTTQGWTEGNPSPNPPTNIASGGPEGANDNYLQNISDGMSGAGSRQVMFNRQQWSGDYTAAGVQSIRMWVRNEGNIDFQVRIAINGANTWFGSSSGFNLPAGNEASWQQVSFDLDANGLTLAEGQASLASVLADVDELRILAAITPDFRGEIVAATLGVDNIEAVGPPPALPRDFLDLVSLADVDGNNTTDVGTLWFDPNNNKNTLDVVDGASGDAVNTVFFGSNEVRDASAVADGNGDMIPEYGVLVDGSLFATVKDVVSKSLIGSPRFNANYTTIALLSVGDAGGGNGPDVALVGRLPSTGSVQAFVKDVASGDLVKRIRFNKSFVPVAAVAVDNVGESPAMEVAVLGVNANGRIQAQIKDALNGNLIKKVQFNRRFAPLFFAAVHDANGGLTNLAVLGINANGVIQAQVKRVIDDTLVKNVRFSKSYVPVAFFSHTDSNGNGSGELTVVGINASGTVRAQTKEIGDGSLLSNVNFNSNFPPLAAIGVNGAAGTARNEIAVLGQRANGDYRLFIKDLLTGDNVLSKTLP